MSYLKALMKNCPSSEEGTETPSKEGTKAPSSEEKSDSDSVPSAIRKIVDSKKRTEPDPDSVPSAIRKITDSEERTQPDSDSFFVCKIDPSTYKITDVTQGYKMEPCKKKWRVNMSTGDGMLTIEFKKNKSSDSFKIIGCSLNRSRVYVYGFTFCYARRGFCDVFDVEVGNGPLPIIYGTGIFWTNIFLTTEEILRVREELNKEISLLPTSKTL